MAKSQLISFNTVNKIFKNSLSGSYNSYVRLVNYEYQKRDQQVKENLKRQGDIEKRIYCNSGTILAPRCQKENILSSYCEELRSPLEQLTKSGASNINTHNAISSCTSVIEDLTDLLKNRDRTNFILVSQVEHIKFIVQLAKKLNNYAIAKSKEGKRAYYPFDTSEYILYSDIVNVSDEDKGNFVSNLVNYTVTLFVEPLKSQIGAETNGQHHQYHWLYDLLDREKYFSRLNNEEVIFRVLAIVMLLALDMKELNRTSEPFMRAIYKFVGGVPDDFDSIYRQYKHNTTMDEFPTDEQISIAQRENGEQSKPTNNLIAQKIKENQKIEELEALWKELIALMMKDLWSCLILDSRYSVETKAFMHANREVISEWEQCFDQTPTYQGKLEVYQSAQDGYVTLLESTRSFISTHTQNRSK